MASTNLGNLHATGHPWVGFRAPGGRTRSPLQEDLNLIPVLQSATRICGTTISRPRLTTGNSIIVHVTKRRLLLAVAVAALVVLAGMFGAGTLLVVRKPLNHPDAIVSLASHEWERLPATARLAHENPAASIILTLPEKVTIYNCHDCGGRLSRLQHLGIPPDRVHTLPLTSPGTYGEALAVLAFTHRNPVNRLLIVTTPYHTRRSLAAFRSVFAGSGVEIGVEPADSSPARPTRWWATPYDRAYVVYEWAATADHAVRYHII